MNTKSSGFTLTHDTVPTSVVTNNSNTDQKHQKFRRPHASEQFTFHSPTQGYGFGNVNSHQNSILFTGTSTSSTRNNSFVPGVGVSWQHAVPYYNLANNGAGPLMTQAYGFSNFVNHSEMCSPNPMGNEPQPSCSSQPRRPKRRHQIDQRNEGPQTKIHLTEERMMHKMRNMSLGDNTPAKNTDQPPNSKDHWKNFFDLEDRISEDGSSNDTEDDCCFACEENNNNNVTITVNNNIASEILHNDPLLPRKIMHDIVKPKLEVVLWQPPGERIREAINSAIVNRKTGSGDRHRHETDTASYNKPQDFSLPTSSSLLPLEPGMDMFDGIDDEMDMDNG